MTSNKKRDYFHRNIGPKGLRNRYLRHLHDDPDVQKRGRSFEYIETDDSWDPYDPYLEYLRNCQYEGDPESYNIHVLMDELLNISDSPFHSLDKTIKASVDSLGDTGRDGRYDNKHADFNFEEYLYNFIRRLEPVPIENLRNMINDIKVYIDSVKDIEVLKQAVINDNDQRFAKIICLFAPFWLRSPQTWNGQSKESLVDHIFIKYKVPGFLYKEWNRELDEIRYKWLVWFILLGQGGSLKRASEYFQWNIPSRFHKLLFDVPSEASPLEACIFAEVKRLGGSEIDFGRLINNHAFVIDPTEISSDENHAKFWYDTVRWLINNSNEITDDQAGLILEWAMHEYTEAECGRGRPFSWKGRRLRSVLERSNEYDRQRSLPYSNYKWNKHGWDLEYEEAPAHKWTFIELTSGKDLYLEGKAMRHCVSSYAGRCASGHSAIVSLRCNVERRVTIEINPRTLQIVQIKGTYNRNPDKKDQQIISFWQKEILRKNRDDPPK
jgi:hypothetical protein